MTLGELLFTIEPEEEVQIYEPVEEETMDEPFDGSCMFEESFGPCYVREGTALDLYIGTQNDDLSKCKVATIYPIMTRKEVVGNKTAAVPGLRIIIKREGKDVTVERLTEVNEDDKL